MVAAQVFGKTTLISGMANADGMCRPLTDQVFVFSGGQFIGTLSPILMDSRTDGSLVNANLYREDYIALWVTIRVAIPYQQSNNR